MFAPHPDDEILGCGGTMIKHIGAGDEVYVCIVTKGCLPLFTPEGTAKTRSEARACHQYIGVKKTFFLDFPAVMIDKENRYEVNGKILDVVMEVKPDDVYIPHWGDMQKDHQMTTEAAMVAEFIPNVFVDVSDTLCKKIEALGYFKSQLSPFPDARSLEAIEALAKYRGSLMHVKAAEAFMLIREIR